MDYIYTGIDNFRIRYAEREETLEESLFDRNGAEVLIGEYLAKLTEDRNCGRLEWWVHDWNESAAKLYRGLGAFKLDNLRIYRMCGDELETFAKVLK